MVLPHEDSACNITVHTTANLTCSAYEYFPSIALQFEYISSVVESIELVDVINTDGTRNKSITITITPSDAPYTCVVRNIPGFDEEEKHRIVYALAASQSIANPTGETTTEGKTDIGGQMIRKCISFRNHMLNQIQFSNKGIGEIMFI